VIVDIRTHFDLFDLLRLLALTGEIRLFLRFEFEFADVQIFAYRRISIGGDFNQIQPDFGGLCYRFTSIENANIFAILVDNTNFFALDEFIIAWAAFDGRRQTAAGRWGSDSKYS
jgi:hypothetical protein